MNELEKLRAAYRAKLEGLAARQGTENPPTADELKEARDAKAEIEAAEKREQDNQWIAAQIEESERLAAQEQARSAETRAKIGEAARLDVAGEARKRDAEEMVALRDSLANLDRGLKLNVDYSAARDARILARLGVTPEDIGQALRHNEALRPERNADGDPDVRAYSIGAATAGATTIPTITATVLYDEMEFIGGIRASGAETYTANPLTRTDFPKVTAHGGKGASSTVHQIAETGDAVERDDTLGQVVATPRRYAGLAIASQAMLTSNVVGFSTYLARALGRSVGRDMEWDFHFAPAADGPSAAYGLLLTATVPTGRIVKTGGNTTPPRVQDYAGALGRLDAAYHGAGNAVTTENSAGGNRGVRWLGNSQVFFTNVVGATATDGHFIYPLAAQTGMHFGRPWGFSSFMAGAPAANALVAVAGNFFDAYLIAESGIIEVSFDTSVRFDSSQVTYKGECYAQGVVRDFLAVAYIQTAA